MVLRKVSLPSRFWNKYTAEKAVLARVFSKKVFKESRRRTILSKRIDRKVARAEKVFVRRRHHEKCGRLHHSTVVGAWPKLLKTAFAFVSLSKPYSCRILTTCSSAASLQGRI